jgi:hypothetical protein
LSTNACAKAFFPSVWSAKALLNRRTNATTTQIITGHCYLKTRINFVLDSPSQPHANAAPRWSLFITSLLTAPPTPLSG